MDWWAANVTDIEPSSAVISASLANSVALSPNPPKMFQNYIYFLTNICTNIEMLNITQMALYHRKLSTS